MTIHPLGRPDKNCVGLHIVLQIHVACVRSVLLCQSREVPLHMQKIAGRTMPLERHGSLKSELYLKGGRLPLPTLVSDTWCERVIMTGLNKSSLMCHSWHCSAHLLMFV